MLISSNTTSSSSNVTTQSQREDLLKACFLRTEDTPLFLDSNGSVQAKEKRKRDVLLRLVQEKTDPTQQGMERAYGLALNETFGKKAHHSVMLAELDKKKDKFVLTGPVARDIIVRVSNEKQRLEQELRSWVTDDSEKGGKRWIREQCANQVKSSKLQQHGLILPSDKLEEFTNAVCNRVLNDKNFNSDKYDPNLDSLEEYLTSAIDLVMTPWKDAADGLIDTFSSSLDKLDPSLQECLTQETFELLLPLCLQLKREVLNPRAFKKNDFQENVVNIYFAIKKTLQKTDLQEREQKRIRILLLNPHQIKDFSQNLSVGKGKKEGVSIQLDPKEMEDKVKEFVKATINLDESFRIYLPNVKFLLSPFSVPKTENEVFEDYAVYKAAFPFLIKLSLEGKSSEDLFKFLQSLIQLAKSYIHTGQYTALPTLVQMVMRSFLSSSMAKSSFDQWKTAQQSLEATNLYSLRIAKEFQDYFGNADNSEARKSSPVIRRHTLGLSQLIEIHNLIGFESMKELESMYTKVEAIEGNLNWMLSQFIESPKNKMPANTLKDHMNTALVMLNELNELKKCVLDLNENLRKTTDANQFDRVNTYVQGASVTIEILQNRILERFAILEVFPKQSLLPGIPLNIKDKVNRLAVLSAKVNEAKPKLSSEEVQELKDLKDFFDRSAQTMIEYNQFAGTFEKNVDVIYDPEIKWTESKLGDSFYDDSKIHMQEANLLEQQKPEFKGMNIVFVTDFVRQSTTHRNPVENPSATIPKQVKCNLLLADENSIRCFTYLASMCLDLTLKVQTSSVKGSNTQPQSALHKGN